MISNKIFKIYGIKTTLEAINARKSIKEIWLLNNLNKNLNNIKLEAIKNNIKIKLKSKETLNHIFKEKTSHQGVISFIQNPLIEYHSLNNFFKDNKSKSYKLVILDSITDVRNLGAILRNCDHFGVSAVIIPKHNSAKITESVYRTSRGAIYYISLIWVTNISDSIKKLKQKKFWIYGMDLQGNKKLKNCDFKSNIAIILGSENLGMRKIVKKSCDELIRIDSFGKIKSLNVSVACGIALYEIRNQDPV